jgi:APA family basic amino acid/polyamine antiporter
MILKKTLIFDNDNPSNIASDVTKSISELTRHMSLFHLTVYGIGLILGSGIYVLIGKAAWLAGDSMDFFCFGTVVAIFAEFSYAKLSSVFPKTTAEYTSVKKCFQK